MKYHEPIPVLDHGYVSLVDHWGSDEDVVEAARMSTGKGFLGWGTRGPCTHCQRTVEALGPIDAWQHCGQNPSGGLHEYEETKGDERLLAYLWKNRHTSPFEQCGATFEVKAPIFVFREWHRHRTQSYNEMSARYTPLPDENYVPTVERLLHKGGANKQARSVDAELSEGDAEVFQRALRNEYNAAQIVYQNALSAGVPKELARLVLPVGRFSRMRASSNLLNWYRFMGLRCAENAQWEIRQYANVIKDLLLEIFPRSTSLFVEQPL